MKPHNNCLKNLLLSLAFTSLTFCLNGQIPESNVIDSIFAEWNKPDMPGCALGIIKNGELIYSKGYGMGDLEHNIPITPSSVFYIGSVSKQFVTFCILILEETGKLNLDDKIQKYLPDFPEYGSPLTIINFIHHTSGVRDFLTLMDLKGRSYLDHVERDEVYELIKRQKVLNFSPGEQYLYSNSCYFMLAMIIEKVSGQSLSKFAKENIFNPLGMHNTIFYDNNMDIIKNRVFSYEKRGDEFNNLIMRYDLVGSGGVYTSVNDLFLWDQNFYKNKLGKGGQEIILKMHEEGLLNNGKSCGYAYGLQNGIYKGLRTVSHSGALAGYRAELLRFPEQNFSVIILSNRSDANPASKAYLVADLFLKNAFIKEASKEIEFKQPKSFRKNIDLDLDQFSGNYVLQPGFELILSVENDSLKVFQNWNKSSYTIVPMYDYTFKITDNSSITFEFSEMNNGKAEILTINQNGNKTILKRKKIVDLSKIHTTEYPGNYYCKELDFTYVLFITDEILKVKIGNRGLLTLDLYDKDQFTAAGTGLIFRFIRIADKSIGFELDAGRVRNLLFIKQ